MAKQYFKAESKKEWYVEQELPLDDDKIKLGAVLRIADAVEKMAQDRAQLERDLKWWKERAERYETVYNDQRNSNRSLRGQITKLKKKIKAV